MILVVRFEGLIIMSFWQEWKYRSLGEIFADRIRAWWQFPEYPLPWSTEIETAVLAPDAIPVCHRCITPCDLPAWFCPSCGAAFGPYNNILPFVRIYSIGEALRSGVGTEAHFTPFRMLAYISIGLVEYQIFAPLYYFRLYRNYRRTKKEYHHSMGQTTTCAKASKQ